MKLEHTHQLGLNIRQYREDKKISQEAIAFQMGISQSTLSRIENGQIDVNTTTLQRLALALKTTAELLQTYHLPRPNGVVAAPDLMQLLAHKDQTITTQQAEIAFLRQQITELQQLLASCLRGGEDALSE